MMVEEAIFRATDHSQGGEHDGGEWSWQVSLLFVENPFERLQPFPSYAANGKFLLLPICPLLTCISQSAQSLHSPFLQNWKPAVNGKFLLLSPPSYTGPSQPTTG